MARRTRSLHPQAGFTLLEALVALAVMAMVLIGVLSLLQFNSRVAKAQVNVAEMQQSLRVAQGDIVRQARMAGRGGLPSYRPAAVGPPAYDGMLLPAGAAISVANNVAAGTRIGGSNEATVRPDTDVLTLRGVFSTTFYQVNPLSDGVVPNTGTGDVVVRNTSPTGVPQDLAALKEAIGSGRPEALLLVGTLSDDIQAVVQLTGGIEEMEIDGVPAVQLSFTTAEPYLKLTPNGQYPAALTAVAAVGILEEYRYYVRQPESGPPRLSRARLYPGTENAHAGAATNLHVDVADNVLDLQIALGIDRDATERIEDTQNGADDWLLNSAADDPATTAPWNDPARPLYYLRISTLARTDRLDPEYTSPPIQAIEDHVYNEPDAPADMDSVLERRYRRRLLQTVVDLRNLS